MLLVGLVLIAALLGGCNPKTRTKVPVLVLEHGGYMMVLDGSPVTLSFRGDEEAWPQDLTSGDIIEITWDGYVMETYPGQAIIDKCRKAADGDLADISGELLENLASMGWEIVKH